MKARILMEFRDKDNFDKIYRQGDIIEVTRERYQELKALELAEEVRDRKQLDKLQELLHDGRRMHTSGVQHGRNHLRLWRSPLRQGMGLRSQLPGG